MVEAAVHPSSQGGPSTLDGGDKLIMNSLNATPNDTALQLMEKLLSHRKEKMFFMIINLLRMRPTIFME